MPVGEMGRRQAAALARADAQLAEAQGELQGRHSRLPLRYWRQTAHFSTPAADETMARKAVERGTGPMARLLERWRIEPAELADRLGVDSDLAEGLLARPRRAPLVVLDGEDAQALRDDVAEKTLVSASELLADADWQGDGPPVLRFYRPPGFALGSTARELYGLLWALVERCGTDSFPLDGIVFPKIEHAEEAQLVCTMLDDAESALGLPQHKIRLALLVESGWAAAQLADIARAAAARLCALVLGLADYSADVGLPAIRDDHPVADWARAAIVNVAGAIGVPAIDAMTLDYPVADSSLGEEANRERFLERVALVYQDALRARNFGMSGKWVGHPAQLFAVLLAFEAEFRPEVLEGEAAKIEAYRQAVDVEARGATIIAGVMSDRATDRHARMLLRRAVALGRFDAFRARQLGVIDESEMAEAMEGKGG